MGLEFPQSTLCLSHSYMGGGVISFKMGVRKPTQIPTVQRLGAIWSLASCQGQLSAGVGNQTANPLLRGAEPQPPITHVLHPRELKLDLASIC